VTVLSEVPSRSGRAMNSSENTGDELNDLPYVSGYGMSRK